MVRQRHVFRRTLLVAPRLQFAAMLFHLLLTLRPLLRLHLLAAPLPLCVRGSPSGWMNSPTMHRVLNLEIVMGDGPDAVAFQVADYVRTSSRTHDLPMARISVSLFQPSVNGMRRAASSESNRRHFDGRPSSPPLALLSLESSPSPVSPSVVTVAHGIVFIHTVCSLPEFFTGFVVGRFSVASVLAGLVVL